MKATELRAAWRVVRDTGLLAPYPLRAVAGWVASASRWGLSLYSVTAWNAARFPHAPALVEGEGAGQVTTYRALVGRADRIADALALRLGGRDVGGTAVGLLGRSSADFVATLLACGRLGLNLTLLNTTASAAQTLDVCRARALTLLITDDEFPSGFLGQGTKPQVCTLHDLAAEPRGHGTRYSPAWGQGRRGSLTVLSSGSTGPAKAVRRRLNPAELLSSLTAVMDALGLRAGAPTLLTLPLFHGHGLMTLGLCLTLRAPLHLAPRHASGQWQVLETRDIEVLVLVPTVLHRLLDGASGRAPALRAVVCGSAPLQPELATRTLRRLGPVLFNLYGSSEGGLIALARPDHLLAAPDSVGQVLPGVQLIVRRANGSTAQPGEVGSLFVHGDMTQADGAELNTGDLGRLTLSGWLFLAGRQDDLLICGGENVRPEEMEARIATLPYVHECAVAGVPSEEYGQALVAFLVRCPEATEVTEAHVHADLAALLPRTLRPVRVSFVSDLPRNALGKLVRRALPL